MAAERRAHEQLDCLQAVWPPEGVALSASLTAVSGSALWTAGQEGQVVRSELPPAALQLVSHRHTC